MKTHENTQLIYYWKDFESNLKANLVGWLGVKTPSKTFKAFNESISESSDSWIISFRLENRKCFPVAVLKATKSAVVDVVNDKGYVDFVYFDPWQSFRLNRPTDTTDLRKFYELGAEIASHYSDQCKFQGLSGLQLVSNDEMLRLITKAREFKGNDLKIYAGSRLPIKIISNKSTLLSEVQRAGDQDKNNDTDEFLKNILSLSTPLNLDHLDQENNLSDIDSHFYKEVNEETVTNLIKETNLDSTSIAADYAGRPGSDVEAVVKRRLGQGSFRRLLVAQHGSTCCVSGLSNISLLIASHIIPWSVSTPDQKTDPENGLLLSVSWDALFDKGFISFDEAGQLLCASKLDEETIICLGVSRDVVLDSTLMTEERKKNLLWHREMVFNRPA